MEDGKILSYHINGVALLLPARAGFFEYTQK
jgi:hypothetical protein